MKIIPNSDTIEALLISETADAFLLDCEGDKEWFPKSEVNYDAELGQLEAPMWLLKKKFPDEY